MSYQLHPLPDGLHYKPFYASFDAKPMWSLLDGDGLLWIDLRSVFRVLRTTWPGRWRGYCEAKQRVWGLEACCDRKIHETMLAPAGRMAAILGEIEGQLLKIGQATAASRVNRLRQQWRAIHQSIIEGGQAQSQSLQTAVKRRPPSKRKVNAWVVRQLFTLTGKGHKRKDMAKALGISMGTLEQVVAGTYPCLDPESSDAWWETFGTQNTAAASFEARKTSADIPGCASGSPQAIFASQGLSARLCPTANQTGA